MGKRLSKHPPKSKTDSAKLQSGVQNVQQEEEYEIYDPEKYHLEAIEILKKEFKEDPEMFILNMLLMSFMFFDDYQKVIRTLVNTSSERGKKLNLRLIRDHQKQILTPDSVLESVNKRVKFQSSHGPKKDILQPLVPQRMFIVHDTIEIEDKNISADYSRIDKLSYRADIEESKQHKGFVKVNLLGKSEKIESEIRTPSTDSASSSSSSKRSKRKSLSSLASINDINTESDYGYRTITAARTPKKIQISEKDIYTKLSKLPSKCITPVKVKTEENLSNSDSDEESDSYRENIKHKKSANEIQLFRTHYFLNSLEFMAHFENNIFPNTLGEVLGFTNESIHRTRSIAGAIYCDTIDDDQDIIQWEIIPAVAMPWPDEIAFEWTLRRRRTVLDKKEKTPIAYKWPTQKMVEEVNKLSCVVIPRGYIPKRPKKDKNSEMHIEWEVEFPKAEKYLEFRMSHAQMRVFLYLIILHKYFIEPLTEKRGLIVDHIRMLMFWECENNYKAWPEHKLGTKLKLVLKNLFGYLSKADLPNYFIRGKNVLENIPRSQLVEAQNVIHRILETPLQYLLEALKNIKYVSGKFYLEPNLEKLSNILTRETVLPHAVHQTVLAQTKTKQKQEEPAKQDKTQKWNKLYREQRRIAYAEKNLEKEESSGFIDSDFLVKKRLNGDVARQIALLTFFIEHFLQIAKKSLKISSTSQTLFYLKQSFYLTKLLEDIDIEKENAKQFQMQIKEEEENCLRKQVTEPKVPLTPKRNSSFFANEILQVKGKEINMPNLNKSYNSNVIENQVKPSSLEVNNNTKFQKNHSSKSNEKEKIVHVEVYEKNIKRENDTVEKKLEVKPHSPSKGVKHVVSFKSTPSDKDNINSETITIDYNDDGESTSL